MIQPVDQGAVGLSLNAGHQLLHQAPLVPDGGLLNTENGQGGLNLRADLLLAHLPGGELLKDGDAPFALFPDIGAIGRRGLQGFLGLFEFPKNDGVFLLLRQLLPFIDEFCFQGGPAAWKGLPSALFRRFSWPEPFARGRLPFSTYRLHLLYT